MNVLVTGGAGFIGSALIGRLAAEGHRLAVVDDGSVLRTADPHSTLGEAVDVRATVLRTARASAPGIPEPVVLQADVADPALAHFFAEVKPEAVVHLAARADVTESVRAPVRGAEVNVCGTVNVLRRCLEFGVRRFLFASTGGALYGDSRRRPTPETAPPAPISPYGASKAAAELYVHTMGESGAMPCTILRLGNVYGPGRGTRATRFDDRLRTEIAGEADAEFVGLKFAGRVQDMVHDGFYTGPASAPAGRRPSRRRSRTGGPGATMPAPARGVRPIHPRIHDFSGPANR